MATPPSYISFNQTAWNTGTSPKTASVTTQIGDVIAALIGAEDGNNGDFNADASGGGLTWTQQQEVVDTDYSYAKIATALADANTSITGSLARTVGDIAKWFGGGFAVFRGSDGIGASSPAHTSGAPSLGLTTLYDNSAILVLITDWNATATTGKTWRTVNSITPTSGNGYELVATATANYSYYVGYYPDAGAAGAKTVGMTAPSGQKYSIAAVEVRGVAGGGSTQAKRTRYHQMLRGGA